MIKETVIRYDIPYEVQKILIELFKNVEMNDSDVDDICYLVHLACSESD